MNRMVFQIVVMHLVISECADNEDNATYGVASEKDVEIMLLKVLPQNITWH